MFILYPAFHLSSYILPGNLQDRLRPNKLLNRTTPCELVGDFISFRMGRLQLRELRGVVESNMSVMARRGQCNVKFYVLLTMHLSIILVNNELDAQFFFMYVYFCIDDHLMCRFGSAH
jgi:hypothetical protein